MAIPKIIWQTDKESYEDLPSKIRGFIDTWKRLNPEWEYRYLSDKDLLLWVKKNYGGEWVKVMMSCKYGVIKADIARLMFLHAGGLYADTDTICNNPIDDWLDVDSCDLFLTAETKYHIQNWCMASAPDNPIVESILRTVYARILLGIKENYEHFVVAHAGAGIVTRSVFRSLGLNNEFPLMDNESDELNVNGVRVILNKKGQDYLESHHVRHIYASVNGIGRKSWRQETNCDWHVPDVDIAIPLHSRIITYEEWKSQRDVKANFRTSRYSLKKLPDWNRMILNKILDNNEGWHIVYFDDKDQVSFIKEEYGSEMLDVHDKLRPGAYKADLFRYLLLYKYPGFWSDIPQYPLIPYDDIIEGVDEVVCKDSVQAHHVALYNAIIYERYPNSLLMDMCIKESIDRVKNKYYGRGSLDITGPEMMGLVAQKINKNYLQPGIYGKLKVLCYHQHGLPILDTATSKRAIQARYDDATHYQKLYRDIGEKHYSEHWNEKTVYI